MSTSSRVSQTLHGSALHGRCKKNAALMAAGKELPLQMGKPICDQCAANPPLTSKKRKGETESESEMVGGYDVTDPFVNDGSIEESEWTEEEEEKAAMKAAIAARKSALKHRTQLRRKLIRPPVEESDDEE